MKPMSKKAQMVCIIPTAIVSGAVMVYCFATNKGGDQPLIYALVAGAVTFLLMYLLAGRRIQAQEAAKEESKASPAASATPSAVKPASPTDTQTAAGGKVDLRNQLTPEEIRILLSDLQTAADRSAEKKAGYLALATEISQTGVVKADELSLCLAAVEEGLGVFSAFGLVPAGHSSLKEKLQKMAE